MEYDTHCEMLERAKGQKSMLTDKDNLNKALTNSCAEEKQKNSSLQEKIADIYLSPFAFAPLIPVFVLDIYAQDLELFFLILIVKKNRKIVLYKKK